MLADFVNDHPLGNLRQDYPRGEIIAIQASMTEAASHFSAPELEALRVVIRLTIEFFHFLQRTDVDTVDFESLLYVDGSVFSGMDSFRSLCQAYRTTQGESRSTLPQSITSRTALKDEFTALYSGFAAEASFEKKCRLLLDLFKLQIVFAGLTYD